MASKAVVKYRTRTVRRRSGGRGGFMSSGGIPASIIAALAMGVTTAVGAYQTGGATGLGYALSAGYTGYQPWDKKWRIFNDWSVKMLVPLLGAMVLHNVANKTGINRTLRKYSPVVI